MTPERFEHVKALFEAAMELPAADRAAFLDRTCEGDEELRREVESLVVSRPGLLDASVPKLTGEPAVTEVVVDPS